MKTCGVITVRSDSTRLPGKCFMPLRGKCVIGHVIERAKTIPGLSGVILATTTRPLDDGLEKIAREHGILCYRGSLSDKIKRWRDAAHVFGADYLLSIDADDPFCDPELCAVALAEVRTWQPEYLTAPKDIACGAFTCVMQRGALDRVCDMKASDDTEMSGAYFTSTGVFDVRELAVPDPIFLNTKVRLTLDYPEDYTFFVRVFDDLRIDSNTMPLREILSYLAAHPEVVAINAFRQQEFIDNQNAKTSVKLR